MAGNSAKNQPLCWSESLKAMYDGIQLLRNRSTENTVKEINEKANEKKPSG